MVSFSELQSLKNCYFIMRHGESEANVAGILTSDPIVCATKYGLTERGRTQVSESIEGAKQRGWLTTDTLIYCSDFKRTVETAELSRSILHTGAISLDPALRERFFGNYDGMSIEQYIEIWPDNVDEINDQIINNVETSGEILERLEKFMNSLEANYKNKSILLVSHGDPLQVLQAVNAGLNPEKSRSLKYIEPGEIRALNPSV